VMRLTTSWERDGRRVGLKEGRKKEGMNLAKRLLRHKFGRIKEPDSAKLSKLKLKQLEDLSVALLDFSSYAELQSWLASHSRNGGKK